MDELVAFVFAPIAGLFFLVLAVMFLPFVLLGQIVYDLTRSAEHRRGLSWDRKSVFQHFKESVWEGVVVYGVAVLGFVAVLGGLVAGAGLMADQRPPVVEEPKDGLVKRAVTAGGKAALAEAEERGWLDRFRGDDSEEVAAEDGVVEDEATEKKPFWKVWD